MRSLWSLIMIAFTKYHGCGNDFIILSEEAAGDRAYPALAAQICHRTMGIGADGLIIVRTNPLEMIYYNSDGSRAPMCGNGIRCFAKFCYDEGLCLDKEYEVMTLAGIMGVKVVSSEPFLVEIDMGKPDFNPGRCGIKTEKENFLNETIELKNKQITVSSCFMGTIHTVVWLDDLDKTDLEQLGRELCEHPIYTEKTNVNMVQVMDEKTLKLMTYERGAGMTYACGTGACASVVIGALEGKCGRETDVLLPLGTLHINQRNDDEVMMTGPAVKVGQGIFEE
ncbi:MAG: diaminopimelate epimerase [Bacillota bacterium]|nr:diaminopimelate epimerase [Bacillota bacterium]